MALQKKVSKNLGEITELGKLPEVAEETEELNELVETEEVQTPEKKGAKAPKVVVNVDADLDVQEKTKTTVKVLMGKNYKGCVGGTRYYLEKGKTYEVPKNMKRILSSIDGMLKPL